jgi:hypothetical protein
MKRIQDMKRATLAEFDEEEADWRETAKRQVEYFGELEDLDLLTPDELDGLDPDEAIGQVENAVEINVQLFVNAQCDVRSWGEMAVARIHARVKAAKKKAA